MTNPRQLSVPPSRCAGLSLILLVFILGLASTVFLVHSLNGTTMQIERDKKTAQVLAEAKAALVGYATSVTLTGSARPGDLPCPDLDNDGESEPSSCGNASGTTGQSSRLGRLPWKTLGISDLRDGNGERLWYAVSNNFKKNTRTTCTTITFWGCLNSDSGGTITVRNSAGTVNYDGTNTASGAIAVIFSPGSPLQRQGAGAMQDRSCIMGTNCDTNEKCTTIPASNTPKCNPINYLDLTADEDNKDFQDSSSNGFIAAEGSAVFNDHLVVIGYKDLMPLLEKRVGAEVITCLKDYAANTSDTRGRYPFAAQLNSGSSTVNYSDNDERRFGRIPDTPFDKTKEKLFTWSGDEWTGNCKIVSNSGWWLNWKELVFYAVASSYKPDWHDPTGCGSCLTVNPPSATDDKKAIVIVAGRALAGTSRSGTGKNDVDNYLEADNSSTGDDTYTQNKATATFNDRLFYIQ